MFRFSWERRQQTRRAAELASELRCTSYSSRDVERAIGELPAAHTAAQQRAIDHVQMLAWRPTAGTAPVSLRAAQEALLTDDLDLLRHAINVQRHGLARDPGMARRLLYRGRPTERPASDPARFRIGDRIRAKNIHPTTHTRLPRYVRGRAGIIESLHGCHVFPDTNALGQGENPQWLYTVRFNARDLWGPDADPNLSVSVDAWEPYLEPAEQVP